MEGSRTNIAYNCLEQNISKGKFETQLKIKRKHLDLMRGSLLVSLRKLTFCSHRGVILNKFKIGKLIRFLLFKSVFKDMALVRHCCGKVMNPVIVVPSHFKICLTESSLFLPFFDLTELRRFKIQLLFFKICHPSPNNGMQCIMSLFLSCIKFIQEYLGDSYDIVMHLYLACNYY